MKNTLSLAALLLALALPATNNAVAQKIPVNYDESKVPPYTLPDVLTTKSGQRITNRKQWESHRPELIRLFSEHVYGKMPTQPVKVRYQTTSVDENALGGKAIRKQISVFFTEYPQLPPMNILLYVPKGTTQRAPVFVSMNFQGNHSVSTDPGIALATRWLPNLGEGKVVNHQATEAARGMQDRRWPVPMILARGYALATVYYGDVEPDHPEGWKTGIRSVLSSPAGPDSWGAIGAWAWGMSRMLDYLETDPSVNAKKTVLLGHSRIGKAALWAGALDLRFAAVIANESGEGGAAVARRWYGETIEHLNAQFPHWFCPQYRTYDNNPNALPVDQHQLLALIAPRPLYVASAVEDQWADPIGQFLGAKATEPVYQLYGRPGLEVSDHPAANQPVGKTIRYHMRTGVHDVTNYDWEQYLKFADEQVK
ncbi:acetylxylan esterase [Nibrella saemangeumensis]|uniref:Acetylxylan esterase n=1 Tax=Nibrella saemangeumensis TaxID=1084526 RepID=A0ABP8MNS4_9BACT